MTNIQKIIVIIAIAFGIGIIVHLALHTMRNNQNVKIQAVVLNPDGTYTGVGSDSDSWTKKQLELLHQKQK